MEELKKLIAQASEDRKWFHNEARRTRIHGMFIDAEACRIREKALKDALEAIQNDPHFKNSR